MTMLAGKAQDAPIPDVAGAHAADGAGTRVRVQHHDGGAARRAQARVDEALKLEAAESTTHHDLLPLIGAARWMEAMASGAADDAAFPLGQCVGLIDDLPTCADLIGRIARAVPVPLVLHGSSGVPNLIARHSAASIINAAGCRQERLHCGCTAGGAR